MEKLKRLAYLAIWLLLAVCASLLFSSLTEDCSKTIHKIQDDHEARKKIFMADCLAHEPLYKCETYWSQVKQ